MSDAATLSLTDYIVFFLLLLGSSLVGVYYAWKSRKQSDTKEYLTGDPTIGVLPVTLSLVASLISSLVVLGIPAEMFTHSTQYWFSNLGSIIGIIITDRIFLPVFYPQKLTSINKYLLKRFEFPELRVVSSLSFIISNILISGTVIYGPALAISSVTPMSLETSIVAVGVVCTFYTTVGGMKAVIWTDVLQLGVMVAGMLMVAIKGTIRAGGTVNVWKIASEGNIVQFNNWSFDSRYGAPTIWETTLGMLVLWVGTFSTNQMCVQRYCSLPSLFKAKLCMYISIPFTAIFLGLSCYCGVAIFANYFRCDPLLLGKITKPDQLMPYFVVDALGYMPGLAGLFIAAVFSGSLSTLSSALNSMTILTWDDFLKKVCKVSGRLEILITKLIALGFGAITIGVAFLAQRMGSVLDMVLLLSGAIVGPQMGTFFLGALCPFANGKSVMVAFVTGQLFCMSFNVYTIIQNRPGRRFPTYVDGCDALNGTSALLGGVLETQSPMNLTSAMAMDTILGNQNEINFILNISPFFMPFMGWAITVLVGIVMSLLTGGSNLDYLDPSYLSPVVRRFAGKKKINNETKVTEQEIPTINQRESTPEKHNNGFSTDGEQYL